MGVSFVNGKEDASFSKNSSAIKSSTVSPVCSIYLGSVRFLLTLIFLVLICLSNSYKTLTELEEAGLDPEELEFMDDDERREILEAVGLDPDDFDF